MKFFKQLGLAAVFAVVVMTYASTASATTLEVNGVTQSGAVAFSASLLSGTSTVWKDTSGFTQNTCASSTLGGTTSVKTGTAVTGALSSLTFSSCTRTVTVDKRGSVEIIWISGTTNGTVYSEETQVTVNSPIGVLNCTTGATTLIGTLTGVSTGQATIDNISALINCGIISSAKWEATYVVTSPEGLGVVN